MSATAPPHSVLRTSVGDLPLHEYHLRLGMRAWSILHTGAMLTEADEQRLLNVERDRRPPYGVALWAASIALAHDVHARALNLDGARVLELGAGTGLPGIVAASLGASVRQTDRQELALTVCRRNAERNNVPDVVQETADWRSWDDPVRYDWILGADVLYAEEAHDALRNVLEAALAPGGRVLLADPFRPASFLLLDALEADGWRIGLSKWTVGDPAEPRAVGVYELAPPMR